MRVSGSGGASGKGKGRFKVSFITRRFFIGGLAAAGATAPFPVLHASPAVRRGRPKLRFGAFTDVHLAFAGTRFVQYFDPPVICHALEWFRGQGVDAVLCGGDIADRSQVDEMQAFADAWFSVFPNDRRPDGSRVERVFVTGNHDAHGHRIYKGLPRIWPDPDELKRHIFNDRRAEMWKSIFHEDYREIFMKDVKGYRFIGSMWDDGPDGNSGYRGFGRIRGFMDANGAGLDPKLPFFYIQHPHPKDTCYGAWAWGHDNGEVTAALSKFPNAVAFSGHSHYAINDDRAIWQGAFTSIGLGSLRYGSHTGLEFPAEGFESTRSYGKDSAAVDAKKFAKTSVCHSARNGLLVSVYDDCILYSRRDFIADAPIGDDWVQPLPAAESKPFAFADHALRTKPPRFAKGAKLSARRTRATNRGGEEKDAIEISIPAVDEPSRGRIYHFEVVAGKKGSEKRVKRVLASGYNVAGASPLAAEPTKCVFAADELPAPDASFAAVPVGFFGARGEPLVLRGRDISQTET